MVVRRHSETYENKACNCIRTKQMLEEDIARDKMRERILSKE